MNITDKNIDGGKAFDFGRTSKDYARYRDIYPQIFYDHILRRGLCRSGQRVLDLGTGTGVLPRNMARYGARWTGTDISENQIEQAKILSQGMNIDYLVSPAEAIDFPAGTFDGITACQCFWYFDHARMAPLLSDMLKPGGYFLILCMDWLPFEDKIAGASEELVLKYSPTWSGAGETVHPIAIPDCYREYFELAYHEEYRLEVSFTRKSWHGRMKTCRGVSASLTEEEIARWEADHLKLLAEITPEKFHILHYAALAELRVKK